MFRVAGGGGVLKRVRGVWVSYARRGGCLGLQEGGGCLRGFGLFVLVKADRERGVGGKSVGPGLDGGGRRVIVKKVRGGVVGAMKVMRV